MSLQGLGLDTQAKLTAALDSPEYSDQQKNEIPATLEWCIHRAENPPEDWLRISAGNRVNLIEFELHCVNLGLREIGDGNLVKLNLAHKRGSQFYP
jgi:hypothetical protein